MRWLSMDLWVELVCRKRKAWIEAWNFQPHPPFSTEGTEDRNGVNNLSCFCDEASIWILTVWCSESFQVGTWGETWENMGETPGDGMETLRSFLHTLTYVSSPSGFLSVSFFMSFYNKLMKSNLCSWVVWALLENKWSPRRESWEPPIYSLQVSCTVDKLD